jgi:hypothetical protein
MTVQEAIEELQYQSGNHENIESERWENGFLGQLRPYKGVLHEKNYHLIIRALKVLAPELEKDFIDKNIINSIWGICHLGRMWAIHPDGMLQSNKLINKQQASQIDNWLIDVSYVAFCLLSGTGSDEAFADYDKEQLEKFRLE